MKKLYFLRSLLSILLLCVGIGAWGGDVTGTITFGNNGVKINAASVTGNDDQENSWTITTEGTTSFTANSEYYQVGSSKSPATSITFTTTLSESRTIKSFSAKFGGFSGTAGTVTLKVGDTSVGTGSLNATNDVTVTSTTAASGKVLTVTVTGISKGVKCYNVSYTYEDASAVTLLDPELAFAETSGEITLGDSFTLPSLTNKGDGAVTYSSSKTSVAKIDETTGDVEVLAAGTTTFTASSAKTDTYKAGTATYTLTVKPAPFTIEDGVFDFTVGENYGSGYEQTSVKVQSGTWTAVNVTMTTAGRNCWYTNNDFRLYAASGDNAAGSITFAVPEGNVITAIAFEGTNLGNIGTTVGSYSTGSWTGSAETVTFIATATTQITKITVTYGEGTATVTVATPTFSPEAGTYTEAQSVTISCTTDGATIYYTTDGTDPTNASTQYTTAITVEETTTIKAIAYLDGTASEVAEAVYTIESGSPSITSDWQKVELSSLTSTDVFVIVGNNGSNYAMTNNNGTSTAPTATAVTVEGDYITSTVAENIKWNISGDATNGYTFYPNGSTSTWLYTTDTNNGVRVGDNANNKFKIVTDYLQNTATNRYVGIYNSADWRCYTSINNNIKDQTFTFYKYVGKAKETPTLSFSNTKMIVKSSSLSEGEIVVPVLRVTPANLTVTYTLSGDDVVTLNSETGVVTLKGTPGQVEGTFTVTATSEENDDYYSASASYTYSIVKVYDNIAALRECASGTVAILNLTDAQVIYESGNDKYVKDETGAIDFYKIDTDTYVKYSVGQRFSGDIYVTYTEYNGLPEITEVHLDMSESSSTAEVTPTSLEVANVTLEDYVCDLVTVTGNLVVSGKNYYISDGANKLQVYNKFKLDDIDLTALESGKTYTATGIVVPYNNVPELALTSIEESDTQYYNLAVTSAGYATLYLGYAVSIPENVTVSYVSGYEGSALTLTPITGTIPANTGVLVAASEGTYTFTATSETGDAITGNYLYGSVTSATTSAGEGSYLYYKLANDSSKGIGFYWGAENGAAFTSAANKAYLAIPAGSGAKISGFALNGSDDATAITAVEDETITNNKVYDLTGREVKNPAKGVYIINGKKIFK